MDLFKGLRITQLDDDDDNEEAPMEQINVDEFDDVDDDEEDDEDCEPVTLGFVESPKFEWSNLRQLFPNLAGGVPVLRYITLLSVLQSNFFLMFVGIDSWIEIL